MTLLLLGIGALAAALGTRAAVLLFAGAAVLGALGSALPAAAAWIAATAAGLALLPASPRRLALPALGAAAALGVGTAENTAVILALWVIATATAVVTRGPGEGARSWAMALCLADLPVVGAVVWTAFAVGFEGWPMRLDGTAAALVLAAAVLRAPLASGPDDEAPEPGLLVVRTQTVVAVILALSATTNPRSLLVTATLLGAAGFAAGGLSARPATRDGIQELSLVAMVIAAARLGWAPPGWEWGALAAGTLMHNLRLRIGQGGASALAGALLVGGGIGLPLLPVVLVGLEGATRADGWIGAGILLGLIGGLAGRASSVGVVAAATGRASRLSVVGTAALIAGIAAGLWAPLLSLQGTPSVGAVGWPPAWATAAVLAVAGLGAALGGVGGGGRPERARALAEMRVPDRWATPAFLRATLVFLAAGAGAMWGAGILRGFL